MQEKRGYMGFLKKALTAVLVTASFLVTAQDNQILIFSDDFNTHALFAENWSPSSATVTHKNNAAHIHKYGASLTCRKDFPKNYRITVKMTIVKPQNEGPGKYGVAGIILKTANARFQIRTDGIIWPLYLNKNRVVGSVALPLENFELGKAYELSLSSRQTTNGDVYVFKIDGKMFAGFTLPKRKDGEKPALFSHAAEVIFDDFKLYKLTDEKVSPNRIINSSFENVQEGMPLFFNRGTIGNYSYNAPYEQFLASQSVDTTKKVSGKQSLKMIINKSTLRQEISTSDVRAVLGKPVLLSVWLKADQDNYPATLSIWEVRAKMHRKTINIGKEWKRYSFYVPELKHSATIRCRVTGMKKTGIVWVDSIQLEIPKKQTKAEKNKKVEPKPTAYMPSSIDKDKFAIDKLPLPIVEPITIKKLSKAPVMDGNIDSWIENASKFGDFYSGLKKPLSKTEAYVACDDDNLYIAVRSYVNDMTKIKTTPTERDDFGLFAQDCIEIFLDPGKSNKNYYQLVVSAANSNTDMGYGRNKAWNGPWSSAVKINKEKKFIDFEVKIPLSMTASAASGGSWGVNIGRNVPSEAQVSSIIPMRSITHHVPKGYPLMKLPTEVARKYAVGVTAATGTELKNGDLQVNIMVENNTGKTFSGTMKVSNSSGKQLEKQDVILKPGKNTLSFTTKKNQLPKSKITVAFASDNKPRFNQTLFVDKANPLTILGRFNYYTEHDKNAVFRIVSKLPQTDKLTAVLSCGNVKVSAKVSPKFAMELPLEKIPFGDNKITLKLQSNGKTVLTVTAELNKKKFRKGPARINHFRQCLEVDGKPILPFMPSVGGWYWGTPDKSVIREVDFLADEGFKQSMITFNPSVMKKALLYFGQSDKRDMKVIMWYSKWSYEDNDESVQKELAVCNSHPSIIAYKVLDEPDLYMKSDDAKRKMVRMMKRISHYPVFMNNSKIGIPANYADLTTDILMIDDYLTNQEGKTVRNVLRGMDELNKANTRNNTHKPVFFWISTNNLSNHFREASHAEQMALTWGAIAKGCTGIAGFGGIPVWPGDWKALKQLNREILALTDVILDEEDVPVATISDSTQPSITRKHNGYLYVFVVNIDNVPSRMTVTLPAEYKYADNAEIEFENRKVPVRDGMIVDEFPGYSRHIYKIRIK